jgi:hypothetical protein
MRDILPELSRWIRRQKPVALATVVAMGIILASGAKMAITARGIRGIGRQRLREARSLGGH